MHSNEIWRLSVDCGFTASCQIRPGWVNYCRLDWTTQDPRNVKIWSKLTFRQFFALHGRHNALIQIKLRL